MLVRRRVYATTGKNCPDEGDEPHLPRVAFRIGTIGLKRRQERQRTLCVAITTLPRVSGRWQELSFVAAQRLKSEEEAEDSESAAMSNDEETD